MEQIGRKHENLDYMIYKKLKAMILSRKLLPDSKIYQDKLARNFGVSRTPLINALKKLEHEKLVTGIPRKGYYVRSFSREEMIFIFELREVFEGLAAKRAAIHISDGDIQRLNHFFEKFKSPPDFKDIKEYANENRRFHDFLVKVAGRDLLSKILDTYNIFALSYLGDFKEGMVRLPQETHHEHLAIIEAISKRDAVKAEKLARLHISLSRERLINDQNGKRV